MFITRYSLPITIYFGVKIRWRVDAKRQDLAHKAPIECKMREMTTIGRIFKSHKSNLTLAHLTNKKNIYFLTIKYSWDTVYLKPESIWSLSLSTQNKLFLWINKFLTIVLLNLGIYFTFLIKGKAYNYKS